MSGWCEQKGNKVNGVATDRSLGKALSERIYNFFTQSKPRAGIGVGYAFAFLTLLCVAANPDQPLN